MGQKDFAKHYEAEEQILHYLQVLFMLCFIVEQNIIQEH